FRAVQGVGAGGLLTIAFVAIGVLFNLEERARITGVFAGVWAVSSIVGPLVGGFIVDQLPWPWVFYINIPPGLLAAALIWRYWVDEPRARGDAPVRVDYLGSALLTGGVIALLLGVFDLRTGGGWPMVALALGLFAALAVVERRAADPVLPLGLFRDRLFAAACGNGFLAGWAMFGSIAFVPLFVQAVLGTSATAAGATLTPMSLGWVAASIVCSRLLLRFSFRTLALIGMSLLTLGAFLMSRLGTGASQLSIVAALVLMGVGMGATIPAFVISVQTSVRRAVLGTATSMLQFTRTIGGTLGVSVMGAVLAARLADTLTAAGIRPETVSLGSLITPLERTSTAAVEGVLRNGLASGVQGMFVIAFFAAGLGLAFTALAPGGLVADLPGRREGTERGQTLPATIGDPGK
ncbi:MAG: MFS transporter, partial [bacterium]